MSEEISFYNQVGRILARVKTQPTKGYLLCQVLAIAKELSKEFSCGGYIQEKIDKFLNEWASTEKGDLRGMTHFSSH